MARASEGSVRDSISLLDRALVFQSLKPEQTLQDSDIRKMLGLADKSKLIKLLKYVFEGNQNDGLKLLRELIEEGLDAKNFLNDILELIYLFNRRINLGPIEKELFISDSELELIDQASDGLNVQDLGLFWQLTLKTIEDLNIVSNENITLEMYLMQLMHIRSIEDKYSDTDILDNGIGKNLPEEKITNDKKKNFKPSGIVKEQLKNMNQVKTFTKNEIENKLKTEDTKNLKINSFSDLIKITEIKKEIELKYDLERNVKLSKFEDGKIDINFNENLNKNFIKKLSQSLYDWTGKRWIISLSKEENLKTYHQIKIDKKDEIFDKEKQSEAFKEVIKNFPDAKLIDVGTEDE